MVNWNGKLPSHVNDPWYQHSCWVGDLYCLSVSLTECKCSVFWGALIKCCACSFACMCLCAFLKVLRQSCFSRVICCFLQTHCPDCSFLPYVYSCQRLVKHERTNVVPQVSPHSYAGRRGDGGTQCEVLSRRWLFCKIRKRTNILTEDESHQEVKRRTCWSSRQVSTVTISCLPNPQK